MADVPDEPPRLVLDTNVFVAAAFNPRSHSARIIAGVREGVWRLIWNRATRDETRAVLERIPRIAWAPYADLFREANAFTFPTDPVAFSVVQDPADREFAALAAAAGAVLVSNDAHLLGVRERLGVTVRTPGEFLAGWGGARGQ